jgi:hypothetical protein
MKKSILVALLLLAALATSCTGRYTNMTTNRDNLLKLKAGMSITEVEEIMGQADFKDVLFRGSVDSTTLWYFTNELGTRGFPAAVSRAGVTREDCTPLVFKDSKLMMSGSYVKTYY